MKKIRVGVNEMRVRRNVWAAGGVKIMAIPYEKDKALCSPTSAFEKKRMLSKELRNPS